MDFYNWLYNTVDLKFEDVHSVGLVNFFRQIHHSNISNVCYDDNVLENM